MRIIPCCKYKTIISKQTSFGSVLPDINVVTFPKYTAYDAQFQKHGYTGFHDMFSSGTLPFREYGTQQDLFELLNPNEKTQINILGCSDGSEAYAYAITATEKMGKEKAMKNVRILGVDNKPYLISVANSGRMVCSEFEKDRSNRLGTPLAGNGWNKYLTKSSRPQSVTPDFIKYPQMFFLENNPLERQHIGNGLDWYSVNKSILPELRFETGDLMKYLKSTTDAKNEVFVIANTGGYLLGKDGTDFINIFRTIKDNFADKKDKNVFVVMGELEKFLLGPDSKQLTRPTKEKICKTIIETLCFDSSGYPRILKLMHKRI